jgi:ATP-dependent Clp protease ATP-binding subunit ClpC
LQANARRIDDHLLNLLQILGEEVVAAEPSLPLRLLPRVSEIPLLNSLQRQLLGVKICFGEKAGCSSGSAPNAERGQVSGVENSRRTDWISLLPSQLALPQEVRDYRYFRGELLFRTRTLPDPPELRPTILILDVSPTTAGEIEDMLRLAAFALTRALYQAQVPVVLITPGDRQDGVISLEHPSDWVEIWTQQSPAPVNEVRLLRLAKAVQANLRSTSNQEPIILLLSQPWFGAEAKIASLSGLRGLFVQYPDYEEEEPFLVSACDRWATLFPHEGADLGRALGYVLG